MIVKQISIFIENITGKLAEAIDFLAQNKINLRNLSIADTGDFGIVRIICEKPDEALALLREAEYIATITEVVGVEIADEAGSLAKILYHLSEAEVSIEYSYVFLSSKKNASAYMILRVDDNDKAIDILNKKGVNVVGQEDIF